MHDAAYRYVRAVLRRLPPRERVVEIGSLDVNGSVRELFGEAAYTGIDQRPGRGVDVVSDGAVYQPSSGYGTVDTVVCCEVLEHAPNGAAILANAHAMLEKGGVLIVTAGGEGRVPHGCDGGLVGREHYRNVTKESLQEWLMPFGRWQIEVDRGLGDIRAWAVK